MKLWVDDERPVPDVSWTRCLNSRDAIACLDLARYYGIQLEAIALDHDLGGDDTTRPVVLWMAEHDEWPKKIWLLTQNPVGGEWLAGMIRRYGPGVTGRLTSRRTGEAA